MELPARFIGEAITVSHSEQPALEKRPGPPASFEWQGRRYDVAELVREWHDYRPRGSNHSFYEKEQGSFRAAAATRRGTWGVGRDYFRVRTESGEVFDVYFDRNPSGPGGRKGSWFLFRQILDHAEG